MNNIDTYCPECDEPVSATLEYINDTLIINNKRIDYIAHVAICPICGDIIADARTEGDNLQLAYDIYDKLYGDDNA